jgi:hypothetical protein
MAMGMKIAASVINWTIAALIASLIAFLILTMHTRENKPCLERPCYAKLDSRLAAIEAEMKVRTQDRYTGTDAKRDLHLMQRQIEDVRSQCLKQMQRT